MKYSAAQILKLWQNSMLEFHCCECFKDLKRNELEKIEQIREARSCNNCGKEFGIYHFAKEYNSLKIKEIENLWLNSEKLIFCSRFCEKQHFRTKNQTNKEE